MAFYDRVKFTTATTGTGTITVGSAVAGFRTPAGASIPNAGTFPYVIEEGTAWEVGTGTYTSSGTTVARSLIASSTGSLISLGGSAIMYVAAIASTLGQYSEGTFTPALKFGGNSVGMTYGNGPYGRYVRQGRLVHVDIFFALSAKGSSTGVATVTGLPFAALGTPPTSVASIMPNTLTTVACPMARIYAGSAIDLFDWSGSTLTALTDADFVNGTDMQLSINYQI